MNKTREARRKAADTIGGDESEVQPPTFRYHTGDLPDRTYSVAFHDVDSWSSIQLETRWSSLGLVRRHRHGRWSPSCRRSLSADESPTLAELHEATPQLRDRPDRQRPFADLRSCTLLAIHHDLHHPAGQQAIEEAARSASDALEPGQPQTAGAT